MKHYEITNLTTSELADLRQALDAEIEQRQSQLAILTDTLEALLAAGANDAVIENILQAIDILDAATDTDDRCPECGAHIAEPHNPDCPHADTADEIPDAGERKAVIAMLRSEGYKAPGLEGLVTLYHRDLAELEWRKAEDATRGHMTRSQYQGYDTRRFWFCNMRELRKYASDELLTWFDENGRLTRAQLRANLLGGKHYAGSGYINNR